MVFFGVIGNMSQTSSKEGIYFYKVIYVFMIIMLCFCENEGWKVAKWRGKLSNEARIDLIFPGKCTFAL